MAILQSFTLALWFLGILVYPTGADSIAVDSVPSDTTSKNSTVTDTSGNDSVAVIPVEGQVDGGLAYFLKRAINDAKARDVSVVVFKVNTFGGELGAAFEIVDLLMDIDWATTYAFVEKKAISAGAMIALSCNKLIMENGSTIGDCAPITQSQEGIKVLGEKIQSPLRAKFRTMAERNGYPSLLSQSMVTQEMVVVAAWKHNDSIPEYFSGEQWEAKSEKEKNQYESFKTVVDENQLLTMTAQEAKDYGFAEALYKELDDFLKTKGWQAAKTEFIPTWSEDLARWLGKIAPLLLLIGFGALYMETKTPGFGVFGIVGILLLAVVFASKFMAGLADHTELLIFILGAILFLIEIFIFPGTFFFALAGILTMAISIIMAFQSFSLPDPTVPWQMEKMLANMTLVLGIALLALFIPWIALKIFGERVPTRAGLIPNVTLQDARVDAEENQILQHKMQGKTRTPLRPGGKAEFKGKLYEVASRGEFIDAGKPVEIISRLGNNILVREVKS